MWSVNAPEESERLHSTIAIPFVSSYLEAIPKSPPIVLQAE